MLRPLANVALASWLLSIPLLGQTPTAPAMWARPTRPAQSVGSPRPIGSGRLVYDEHRRQVILLDAIAPAVADAGTPAVLRTWSWDGREWTLLPGVGPVHRIVNAAVYDTKRRRIVMFGGTTVPPTSSLGETWEIDGPTWTPVADVNAPARDHHTMAYDSARVRTVLFGGGLFVRGQPYQWHQDTWEWDGVTWRQMATSGPGARSLVGMAYDATLGQIMLFGGWGGRTEPNAPRPYFNDTWLWNGHSWRKVAESGPPQRYGQATAFDTRAGAVLMYGGSTEDIQLEDMWQWDGRRWSEITLTGPTPGVRFGAAMVYDAARDRTVLYGGRSGETSTWEWNGKRWTEIK